MKRHAMNVQAEIERNMVEDSKLVKEHEFSVRSESGVSLEV